MMDTVRFRTKLTVDNGRVISEFVTEAGRTDAIARVMDLYNAVEVAITLQNGTVVYTREIDND